jgi:hypothetical protein
MKKLFKYFECFKYFQPRRTVKEILHVGLKEQPSIKELYEHKCSCGKKLEDHPSYGNSCTGRWNYLKEMYDLGTCDRKGRRVDSKPNGFGKFRTYFFVNKLD